MIKLSRRDFDFTVAFRDRDPTEGDTPFKDESASRRDRLLNREFFAAIFAKSFFYVVLMSPSFELWNVWRERSGEPA
jgi:hypothetical protein